MNNYIFTLLALILPILTKSIPTDRKGLITGLFLSLLFVGKSTPYLVIVPVAVPAIILWRTHENRPVGNMHLTAAASDRPAAAVRLSPGPALPLYIVFLCALVIMTAMSSSATLFLDSPLSLLFGACGAVVFGIICDAKNSFIGALYLIFLQEVSVCITAAAASAYSFRIAACLSAFCIGGLFTVLPMISHIFWRYRGDIKTYLIEITVVFALWVLISVACSRAAGRLLASNDFLTALLLLSALAITFLYVSWKRRLFIVTRRRIRRS
ncbi:MAG: hypothetical protein ACI4LC_08080 [Emergencia sp.]